MPPGTHCEPAGGGASGDAWRAVVDGQPFLLRRSGSSRLTAARVAAMRAARDAGLPAPSVIARAPTDSGEALLLSWLPGMTMSDAIARAPRDARRLGRLMGHEQRRLHDVVAPAAVIRVTDDGGHPFGAGATLPGLPAGDRLLHLDWHPRNLLVDVDARRITGIIDWDNARAGDPMLDVVRSETILTLEPSLADLPSAARSALGELIAGWREGYGPGTADPAAVCRLWAATVMLADLEPRYAQRPTALDGVRRQIADLERDV